MGEGKAMTTDWMLLLGVVLGMAIWALLPKALNRLFSWMDGAVIVIAPEDKAKEIEQYLWG